MESELFWTLDDDLFSLWVPTYHMVILLFLEEPIIEQPKRKRRMIV